MSLSIVPPDPRGLTFAHWSSLLQEELAAYNAPRPADEDTWRDWAVQIFALPELTNLGLADPRGYDDWRRWAADIIQVAS